jgi:hypothetical protein
VRSTRAKQLRRAYAGEVRVRTERGDKGKMFSFRVLKREWKRLKPWWLERRVEAALDAARARRRVS